MGKDQKKKEKKQDGAWEQRTRIALLILNRVEVHGFYIVLKIKTCNKGAIWDL